jgi:hypothetical protein
MQNGGEKGREDGVRGWRLRLTVMIKQFYFIVLHNKYEPESDHH